MKKLSLLFCTVLLLTSCGNDTLDAELDEFNPMAINAKVKTTYVPDDGFEQLLIDLGYDDIINDYVLTNNISSVDQLNIDGFSYLISDLTGIEDFEALRELEIDNTEISSLELSKFTDLTDLTLRGNLQISNVDISKNFNLERIYIRANAFSIENFSKNKKLKRLFLEDGNITSLDVSKNAYLEELILFDTRITSIDVSKNRNLILLRIDDAPITSLNLSKNSNLQSLQTDGTVALTNLDISKNNSLTLLNATNAGLTSLDVSKNSNLINMNITGNPLTCVKVNNRQLDNIPSGWVVDLDDTYSLNCSL